LCVLWKCPQDALIVVITYCDDLSPLKRETIWIVDLFEINKHDGRLEDVQRNVILNDLKLVS
jgi:hypothetical protein